MKETLGKPFHHNDKRGTIFHSNQGAISTEDLIVVIDEYIDYYDNKRIKSKLKGLTPAQYRNQSLSLVID